MAKTDQAWQKILRNNVLTMNEVAKISGIPSQMLGRIHNHFPVRINDNQIGDPRETQDPVMVQFIPDEKELKSNGVSDPLHEEAHRRAELIIHRYPNRALFLVSNVCASYCRFCTRRRQVGQAPFPKKSQLVQAMAYVRAHPQINEVILSGGDPLIMRDERLGFILGQLTQMPHIKVIRVATRIFTALPERMTRSLVALLARFQPLYVITQFNHVNEFTPACDRAVTKLIRRGIPILNQSVLLAGINDEEETMLALLQAMIERRIRPYYLHQLDPVQGAMHFEVPVARGKEIMAFLRKRIGGYAVPQYVFDDPSQGAKTLLYP